MPRFSGRFREVVAHESRTTGFLPETGPDETTYSKINLVFWIVVAHGGSTVVGKREEDVRENK